VLDIAQADHHGKRFAKMRVDGEQLLNWRCASPAMPALCCVLIAPRQHRYTVMNSIGQLAIAVNVESCSYSDATLVAAHDAWREVNAVTSNRRRLDLSPRSLA
jgi:hypothetical protein